MHPDQAITNVAERQLGLATLAQLVRVGLTEDQIWRKVANGRLTRVHRGVLAVAGSPMTWQSGCLAACLAYGAPTAVSHRAGARLLGLDLRCETPIEVVVIRSRVPRLNGVVAHRSVDLVDDHLTQVGPIPTTCHHRLLVDLGAVAPWWVVRDALEQCISRRQVTPASARSFLESVAKRGRNGCGVLRDVLDRRALADAVSDSPLEERFASLCRDWSLPQPVFQYSLELDGRWRRLDFAYPPLRIAIEVDGYEFHHGREVFEDDRVRANRLEVLGWLVLRFTWRQVTRQPGAVAATVREAIRHRSAETGAPFRA